MDPERQLEAFFGPETPLSKGDSILVAFSGGADSTALLAALCAFTSPRGLRVEAAHIDHRLDPGSAARAETAGRTASALGLDLVVARSNVSAQRRRSESLEMAARRVRYRELGRIASSIGARYVATAHHRDDQAETVLLRMSTGHPLSGLGGIAARRGSIVRPLLASSHLDLVAYARRRGLEWVEDPANQDLARPRNRLRHRVLPALESKHPGIGLRLATLAETARRANQRLTAEFDRRLDADLAGESATVRRAAFEALAPSLVPHALVHLLRRCGCRRRPSKQALGLVVALLGSKAPVGVDLGRRWRIEDARGGRLRVAQAPEPTPRFAYNLTVPGEVRLDELACSLRLRAGRREPWMFRGDRLRAGFSLPVPPGERLIVRNRRPGDRVQPFGSATPRKLKDLLIDHGVPRHERDRLPLLCHSRRILWVPGITIDHEARIQDGAEIWVAEIIPDE